MVVVSGARISLASDHCIKVLREVLVRLLKTTDCDDTVGLHEGGYCATGTSSFSLVDITASELGELQ